ncbi:MAG: hypothetical protein ACXV2E_07310 [Halobacteriota archaeon]
MRGLLYDKKVREKVNAADGNKNKHDILLAQDKIAPCIGCHEVCIPEYCSLLDEWLELLM